MNGIIVVNKPKGYTSRDVVNVVGKSLGTKKIGHTGTLDPIATGVLVLCVGKGLKLVELLTNHDKEYIAKVRLGVETDTLDITGKVLNSNDNFDVNRDDINNVLKKFVGKIKQEVPIYSSVKVNGKKLYEYARNNISVDIPVREVEIYSLELISDIVSGEFFIKCHVSKGTYIRSLIRDIGRALGTYAVMVELERTKLGEFDIEDSYTLDNIKSGNYYMLNMEDAVSLSRYVVDKDLEKKIRNGQVLEKFFDDDMVWIVNEEDDILAIYMDIGNGYVKPYRMF